MDLHLPVLRTGNLLYRNLTDDLTGTQTRRAPSNRLRHRGADGAVGTLLPVQSAAGTTMPTHDDDGKTDAEQYIDQLDRELQPGDVAYDKNNGSWLYVVEVVADTVEAYDDQNDGRDLLTYGGNQLTNCTLQDTVVGAVHLNKNTTKSAGKGRGNSGVYDYPTGRLTRFVPETADDELKRVQDTLRLHALSELLQVASGLPDGKEDGVRRAITEAFGKEVRMDAQSLAQVEIGDQWGADLKADDREDGDAA